MPYLLLCLLLLSNLWAQDKNSPHLDANKELQVHQIQAKYSHHIGYHQDRLKQLESSLKLLLAKDPDNLREVENNCHSRGQVWAEIQILKFKRDLEIRKTLGKADWLIYLKQRKNK